MKNSIIILTYIFLLTACESDTKFSGQVVNADNQPMENVMVQVMSSDIYVMTNENGKFTIDTKERGQELIFKKDGYELLILNIAALKPQIVLSKQSF